MGTIRNPEVVVETGRLHSATTRLLNVCQPLTRKAVMKGSVSPPLKYAKSPRKVIERATRAGQRVTSRRMSDPSIGDVTRRSILNRAGAPL